MNELEVAENITLGEMLRDILEGASFVRLDEAPNERVQPTLILDLTWSLTDTQAHVVRDILARSK